MPPAAEIRILNRPEDLFEAAAAEFVSLASQAVRNRGRFCVVLAGGNTPKSLYSLLAGPAGNSLPWDKICFFWGDERHVPPDHPDSNYRMAYDAMLSKLPARPENIFRIPAEQSDAKVAASAYEQTLNEFFHLQAGAFPRFDLILLGMGPDGHTASLFPGTSALHEKDRLAVANWVENFKTFRITLTLPVLNQSACVIFLVSGDDKASALREVFEEMGEPLPAKLVRPLDGRLLWLVDRAAAGALSTTAGIPRIL